MNLAVEQGRPPMDRGIAEAESTVAKREGATP